MTRDGRVRVQPYHGADVVKFADALGEAGVAAVKELCASLPDAPVSQATTPEEAAGFVDNLAQRTASVTKVDLRAALDELLEILREQLSVWIDSSP